MLGLLCGLSWISIWSDADAVESKYDLGSLSMVFSSNKREEEGTDLFYISYANQNTVRINKFLLIPKHESLDRNPWKSTTMLCYHTNHELETGTELTRCEITCQGKTPYSVLYTWG
jgi:hypothetical protein